MSKLKQTLREQLKVRPVFLGLCAFALGSLLIIPVFAAGEDAPAANHWMALDDINNRVNRPPDVFSPAPPPSPAPAPSPAAPTPGDDISEAGSSGNHSGHGSSGNNNGHGNNEDGVDSSNPGQGGGGPNGAEDPSCSGSTCVDDESGTGGGRKTKKKSRP